MKNKVIYSGTVSQLEKPKGPRPSSDRELLMTIVNSRPSGPFVIQDNQSNIQESEFIEVKKKYTEVTDSIIINEQKEVS